MKRQQVFDRAFHICLNGVLHRRETIESAVARYPDFEAELRDELEAALWLRSQRRSVEPSPEFVRRSRLRLMARIRQERAEKKERALESRQLSLFGGSRRLAYQFAVLLLILASLLAGTSGVAYASQDSLPGDDLYRVKIAVENVQLGLSLQASGDAQLNAQFIETRLEEVAALLAAGRYEDVEEALENLEQNIEGLTSAVDAQDDISEEGLFDLTDQVDSALTNHVDVLTGLLEKVPDQAKPAIENAIQASQHGLEAVKAAKEKKNAHPAGPQGGPPEDKPGRSDPGGGPPEVNPGQGTPTNDSSKDKDKN